VDLDPAGDAATPHAERFRRRPVNSKSKEVDPVGHENATYTDHWVDVLVLFDATLHQDGPVSGVFEELFHSCGQIGS